MGYVVGERFTRAAKVALEKKIPLVCFSATGGARMQEALISLMQMAKTSAIIEKLKQAKLPKGFQRSEFLLEHGAIDMIVHRNQIKTRLSSILAKFLNQPALSNA